MSTTEMSLEERLDFLEFRQELLFEDTITSKFLFGNRVTRKQMEAITAIFQEFQDKIDAGEEVLDSSFEQKILDAVPQQNNNIGFPKLLAKTNHKDGNYEEVFETLYGEFPKFKD